MEKASLDQSPGVRDEASTSDTNSAIISQLNSRSSSPQSIRPTKRHPALPPLREQTKKAKNFAPLAIRPPPEKTIAIQISPILVSSQVPSSSSTPVESTIRLEREDETCKESEKKLPMEDYLVPDSWISFKLEHFYTGVKLRQDSDYAGHSPVPIKSGFKRFFCADGSMQIRSIRQLLEQKFCRKRKYIIHILSPSFNENLEEHMTLDDLAAETEWKKKRPLRILFTLIPPKEPPPSLEKVPVQIVETEAAETIAVEPEKGEEEIQIVNAPVQIRQHPMVLTQQQIISNPEIQRQIQLQMQTPHNQYAMINNQLMHRVGPIKRKRDSSETTPPHQPVQQIHLQQRGQPIMQMRIGAQNLNPQQLQQLQQQYLQKQMMSQEAKTGRMVMANGQGANLFPVKSVPVSQASSQASKPQAALLHKLLLQQAQHQQRVREQAVHQQQRLREEQAVQQHNQRTAQHLRQLQIQAQAVHAAKAAQAINHFQPPPTKKMAIQEALESTPKMKKPPTMTTPVSAGSTPDIALTTPRIPSVNNSEKKFQVPSPPSPPKPQIVAATPSPPAISPIPPRMKPELKPFKAQVSVQPITSVKTTSPPPALSPVIPNNIDYIGEAKLRGQSLGRTLKEALAKNHQKSPQPPMLMDGIRAQHVNGELQMSVPASNLELLRNSTIVPTL